MPAIPSCDPPCPMGGNVPKVDGAPMPPIIQGFMPKPLIEPIDMDEGGIPFIEPNCCICCID